MNLHGSITDLQKRVSQLYLKIGQRFSENSLIRELWSAMEHDLSQQLHSLNALPASFWNQLIKRQDGLIESIGSAKKFQVDDSKEDLSLKICFERALSVEEPTILKIYVPIIRSLRENWTDQVLDFYIMVKAHLARIMRVTQAFSGDPLIIQRSNLLLQNFEKEVQGPPPAPPKRVAAKAKAKVSQPVPSKKKVQKRHPHAPKRARSLVKRVKIRPARTKPLINKVSLSRSRARR